jgi:hypothetical protein
VQFSNPRTYTSYIPCGVQLLLSDCIYKGLEMYIKTSCVVYSSLSPPSNSYSLIKLPLPTKHIFIFPQKIIIVLQSLCVLLPFSPPSLSQSLQSLPPLWSKLVHISVGNTPVILSLRTRQSYNLKISADSSYFTDAKRDACKNIDAYEECTSNCSALEPGFACTIACLIAYCP